MPDLRSDEARGRFDWTGYVLLCLSIYCLMTAIASGNREGWGSDSVTAYWGVGITATILFVLSQLHGESPLLDFKLFSSAQFSAAIALSVVYCVRESVVHLKANAYPHDSAVPFSLWP